MEDIFGDPFGRPLPPVPKVYKTGTAKMPPPAESDKMVNRSVDPEAKKKRRRVTSVVRRVSEIDRPLYTERHFRRHIPNAADVMRRALLMGPPAPPPDTKPCCSSTVRKENMADVFNRPQNVSGPVKIRTVRTAIRSYIRPFDQKCSTSVDETDTAAIGSDGRSIEQTFGTKAVDLQDPSSSINVGRCVTVEDALNSDENASHFAMDSSLMDFDMADVFDRREFADGSVKMHPVSEVIKPAIKPKQIPPVEQTGFSSDDETDTPTTERDCTSPIEQSFDTETIDVPEPSPSANVSCCATIEDALNSGDSASYFAKDPSLNSDYADLEVSDRCISETSSRSNSSSSSDVYTIDRNTQPENVIREPLESDESSDEVFTEQSFDIGTTCTSSDLGTPIKSPKPSPNKKPWFVTPLVDDELDYEY